MGVGIVLRIPLPLGLALLLFIFEILNILFRILFLFINEKGCNLSKAQPIVLIKN